MSFGQFMSIANNAQVYSNILPDPWPIPGLLTGGEGNGSGTWSC